MIPSHDQPLIQPPKLNDNNKATSNVHSKSSNPTAVVIAMEPTRTRNTRTFTSTISVKFRTRPDRWRPAYPPFHFVGFFVQRGITNMVNFLHPYSNIFNHAHIINRELIKLELISPIPQTLNSNSKHSTPIEVISKAPAIVQIF